jgi:hypothetical protein
VQKNNKQKIPKKMNEFTMIKPRLRREYRGNRGNLLSAYDVIKCRNIPEAVVLLNLGLKKSGKVLG